MVNERLRLHWNPALQSAGKERVLQSLVLLRDDWGNSTIGLGDLADVVKNLSIFESKQSIDKLKDCELRFVANEF